MKNVSHPVCTFTVVSPQRAPAVYQRQCVRSYRHHSLSQLGVLADDGRIDVLAKDGSVVVDICQVDVHSSHVAERWRTAICSLYCNVIFMRGLIVQRLNHEDVT